MSKVIDCQALSRAYHDGESQTQVLDQLNLVVSAGESVAILGRSGCGKSTLLNLLAGIDQPSSGQVMISGVDINTLSEEARTQHRAKHLGFVYQFHHLLKDFSALDNVMMPLLIQGVDSQTASSQASDLLTQVGLGERLTHLPQALSGGERQRIAVARALVTQPDCILADEPTGSLDAENAKAVLAVLLSLKQSLGKALIIVTHDRQIAKQMDRILVMEGGRLKPA